MTELTPQHMLHFGRTSLSIKAINCFNVRQNDVAKSPNEGKFMVDVYFTEAMTGRQSWHICVVCDTEEEAVAEKTRFADLYNKAIETLAASEADITSEKTRKLIE